MFLIGFIMKILLTILIIISSIFHTEAKVYDNRLDNIDINKIIVHENRYDKLIDLSLSYMESNPEFAFSCVYKAHEIANVTYDKKKSAECNMIMGEIFELNNDHSTAISYYEEAINDMLSIKDYTPIYNIYIKIADLYQLNGFNSKMCVDAMTNALIYAKKTNDKSSIIETLFKFGDLHLQLNDYKSAISQYDDILKIEENDNKTNAKILVRKAFIKLKNGDYNDANILADSSINLCEEDLFNDIMVTNYGLKAEINDSLGNTEEAKSFYKEAIKLAYEIKEYENCGEYMYKLGTLNKKTENLDQAIEIFSILCDSTETFRMYEICNQSFYQLAKCHAYKGDYKEAYELFNKYDIYYDSAYIIKQEKKLNKINTSHSLSLIVEEMNAKELEDYNDRNIRTNWIISFSIILVLSISLITFIILFSRSKILHHKNKETAYEQQLKIDRMENQLMDIQLKNNKESLINIALHFKSYLEYINPLKDELKEAIELPENEIKNKVKNIYLNIQNNSRPFNNTENINKQINDIYKDFLDRLEQKYPSITKSEKRLCAMLYIDMSSKEIAIITNTTLRSVETSRYRLRKKFNLQRDEDMVHFLRSI